MAQTNTNYKYWGGINSYFFQNNYFCPMINDTVKFSKFIYFRVNPKRCPLHNKEAQISTNGMNYRITNCYCPQFKKTLERVCEKIQGRHLVWSFTISSQGNAYNHLVKNIGRMLLGQFFQPLNHFLKSLRPIKVEML